MSPSSKRPPAESGLRPVPLQPSSSLAIFRARLEAGDYDAIVGRKLRRTLRQAAQEPSLEPELGALRLAMIRLLHEEPNPTRLATGISRLASVAVQAARLTESPDSGLDDIRAAVKHKLDILDAELAAQQSPSPTAVGRVPSGWRLG